MDQLDIPRMPLFATSEVAQRRMLAIPTRLHTRITTPPPAHTNARANVSWAGPGQPIVLTLYSPGGDVAVPLLPKRALTLAQELLDAGVQAIKADWQG
jgi:hypothetical protein